MASDETTDLDEMAAEQGPRWPSKVAAWKDGFREGEQHARLGPESTVADLRVEVERLSAERAAVSHEIERARQWWESYASKTDVERVIGLADMCAYWHTVAEVNLTCYEAAKEKLRQRGEQRAGMRRVQKESDAEVARLRKALDGLTEKAAVEAAWDHHSWGTDDTEAEEIEAMRVALKAARAAALDEQGETYAGMKVVTDERLPPDMTFLVVPDEGQGETR